MVLCVYHLEPLWKLVLLVSILAIGLFFGLRIIDVFMLQRPMRKRPIGDLLMNRQRLTAFSFIFPFLILIQVSFTVFIRLRFEILSMMIMFTFWFQLFSLTPFGFTVFFRDLQISGKIRRREEGNSDEKANS